LPKSSYGNCFHNTSHRTIMWKCSHWAAVRHDVLLIKLTIDYYKFPSYKYILEDD